MPILPENKNRYPANWKFISLDIRLNRANNHCEMCGIANGTLHPRTGKKQTLSVIHLDHTPENIDYSNLRAACNVCHNNHDKLHRIQTAWLRRAISNGVLGFTP